MADPFVVQQPEARDATCYFSSSWLSQTMQIYSSLGFLLHVCLGHGRITLLRKGLLLHHSDLCLLSMNMNHAWVLKSIFKTSTSLSLVLLRERGGRALTEANPEDPSAREILLD